MLMILIRGCLRGGDMTSVSSAQDHLRFINVWKRGVQFYRSFYLNCTFEKLS